MGEVVSDTMFWAFVSMLTLLAGSIREFLAWLQGCDCHPSLELCRRLGVTPYHVDLASVMPCALGGRRAAWLALGKWKELMQRMFEASEAELYAVCSGLNPEERDIIFDNWRAGRKAFMAEMVLKFSYWAALPFLLCAIAADDPLDGRWAASECIRMYDTSVAQRLLHEICHRFLKAGSQFRSHLLDFIRGTPLAEFPQLYAELLRLKWILTVERSIEAKHPLAQRNLRAPQTYRLQCSRLR